MNGMRKYVRVFISAVSVLAGCFLWQVCGSTYISGSVCDNAYAADDIRDSAYAADDIRDNDYLYDAAHRDTGAAIYMEQENVWGTYARTIFNTTNGLMSNNVSSIAQTSDGEVWIGTDKGLSVYDGREFTEYGGFFHFDGVNDMIRTADGGVWFATTTYGGAIFLGSRFQHFDDISETVSNYALCIEEASDGTIYVGTIRNMVSINPAAGFTLSEYKEEGYHYVNSLAAGKDGVIGGTTAGGDVFFIKDGVQLCRYERLFAGRIRLSYANGYFVAGTSDGKIYVFDENNLSAGVVCSADTPIAASAGCSDAINGFFYESGNNGREGRLWVLAEGGIGYYSLGGRADALLSMGKLGFTQCSFDNFESGFTDMMTDYQGNYWISSHRRGVLLLSQSVFKDELIQSGSGNDHINSVRVYDGVMYMATDSGVVALSERDGAYVKDSRSVTYKGKRVTDIAFYNGKQYVAVYGEGVYVADAYMDGTYGNGAYPDGRLVFDGTGRIRQIEIADGLLYVMSDEGCFVIKENKVTDSYTKEDGLYNTKVTSAIKGVFGRGGEEYVYIGSRGAGVYVIDEGSVVRCLDENSGLPSKNVNDLLEYDGGFFIATDGGVAYYNGRKVTVSDRLPDALNGKVCEELFIYEDRLYVVCRDAVFVIDLDDLFNGDKDNAAKNSMYDGASGFTANVSEGAHCFLDGQGRIYIPCAEKIYSFQYVEKENDISSYKIMIQNVKGDSRSVEIRQLGDMEYAVNISKDVEKIDIFCSVLNFSNDDPYVRYILHGVDSKYTVVRSSELEHVIYEELPGGSYTFWFELVDSEGKMAHRVVLNISKEKSLFEKLWVRMICLAAAFAVLMYFVFKDRKKSDGKGTE